MMVFFDPQPAFTDWLIARAKGRLIVDMGCGTGGLLTALWQRGYDKILGVDPRAFDVIEMYGRIPGLPVHRILPQEGQRCVVTRAPKLLIVFARPCHNGWVEDVISYVHASSEVLYISKPEKRSIDLRRGTSRLLKTPMPGHDGERVYRVHHHASQKQTV